jgi:hypothetical protein
MGTKDETLAFMKGTDTPWSLPGSRCLWYDARGQAGQAGQPMGRFTRCLSCTYQGKINASTHRVGLLRQPELDNHTYV